MSKSYPHHVVITPVYSKVLSRTMISKIADSLLEIQDVDAAFVIAKNTDGMTGISARSNGNVNVQVIMEAMGGGGHMTAAAMQSDEKVEVIEKQLKEKIEAYFEEADTDESDTEE